MGLKELLGGFDATKQTTVEEIISLINTNSEAIKEKIFVDDGKENVFIPKARLNEEIEKKNLLQKTLDETNNSIEAIKKSAGDNSELVKTIETLENNNNALSVKMKEQTLNTAIKLKAIELKSKDKTGNVILSVINKENLKLNDDGTILGLDEAFKVMQEATPYLFGEENLGGTGTPPNGGSGGQGGGESSEGIGKKLAEQNAPQAVNLQEAQDSYFK